jgi:hypothetical protein
MPPAADEGQEDHGGNLARVLEAAAFAAFHHQPVDAGSDRLEGGFQRRHDMEHDEARTFELFAIFAGIAGRCGDEFDALIDDEAYDIGIADEGLRDVHAERLVGQGTHLANFLAHRIEFA